MKPTILILALYAFSINVAGQELRQNIKGRVIDQQSEAPLPGVNVYIEEDGEKKGTSTGPDGYYKITDVKIGRVTVYFSYLGYEPVVKRNVELTSSKELVINVKMRESTQELEEVTVKAKPNKERTKNERVNVSGRSFSIEESQRFAGANQDVSRMASNFAGVQRTDDSNNDIVIRGNSPTGLIWRLEGMDIPNPNHFGGLGATGGPVSMLNNNTLANSDFLTGAFPSDYGNGISGVFDLQMRDGNNEEYEFLGQIGFNGLEFGAEGPFSEDSRASFLVNYRYSTLGLFSALGIDFGTGTAIPEYQDLNMKVNVPTDKYGIFELFALGGQSSIEFLDSENEEGEDGGFYSDDQDLRNDVSNGVIGLSHQYFFDNDWYSKVTFAASGISNKTTIDTFSRDGNDISRYYGEDYTKSSFQAHALINKKFNARHVLRAGAYVTRKDYDLIDSVYNYDIDGFQKLRNFDGNDMQYQPYINWQFRISDKLEMNTGLHSMILQSNNNATLEPRFGMSYDFAQNQSLNFGYGLHSQLPPAILIYSQDRLNNGQYVRPNENVDFIKSHHLVLGYQLAFGDGLHFKAETYYQDIYDAVVSAQSSSYSSLNAGSFNVQVPDSASNGGEGYNYGLDLTLEKFLDEGLYFLATASFFESKYRGSDGVLRNTAFNGNYVLNALGGKEFVLKQAKGEKASRQTITVDARVTTAGGQRYTPIDLEKSRRQGQAVYDRDKAYSKQFDPYFRADVRVGYKISGKKFTQEWAIDVQNVTNRDNPFGKEFNPETSEVETTNQLGLFPVVLYRITF